MGWIYWTILAPKQQKTPYFMPNKYFFWCKYGVDLMHILVEFPKLSNALTIFSICPSHPPAKFLKPPKIQENRNLFSRQSFYLQNIFQSIFFSWKKSRKHQQKDFISWGNIKFCPVFIILYFCISLSISIYFPIRGILQQILY